MAFHEQQTNNIMKTINKGTKIGYLNPRTGRYMYALVIDLIPHPITGNPSAQLQAVIKQGKHHVFMNTFEDEIDNIIRWQSEPSKDFKNKVVPLVKIVNNSKPINKYQNGTI
jgi:hypothetical protein